MPPKRKAPLATTDSNTLPPAAKKTATGKKATGPGSGATEQWKYSDPRTLANQEPVDVIQFQWPKYDDSEDGDDSDDEDEDEGDQDKGKPAPGSLQAILDGLSNERSKAVHEALNPPEDLVDGIRSMYAKEARRRIDEAEKPFLEKMEKAKQEFVDTGKVTAEEAKTTVGLSDEDRKGKRNTLKRLQETLNFLRREQHKAVQEALKPVGEKTLSAAEKRAEIAKVEALFNEKMEKVRQGSMKYASVELTLEEANSINPTVQFDDEGNEIKTPKQLEKEAAEAATVAPRVTTQKGFPVSKAGMEKFIEMNQEVDKRDPDLHDMYIYNKFAGYGVTEVMANVLAEFNKIIFKKDVSPIQKWALVEGLFLYLAMGNQGLMVWMMTDDPDAIKETVSLFAPMYIATLEMLNESGLIGASSPLPENIGVMTLHFLSFIKSVLDTFSFDWVHEIIRAADKYGLALEPVGQIKSITQEDLDEWREKCEHSKTKKGMAWKTEYPKYKRNHPGGHDYDITKFSAAEKAEYSFDMRGDSDMDSDI